MMMIRTMAMTMMIISIYVTPYSWGKKIKGAGTSNEVNISTFAELGKF